MAVIGITGGVASGKSSFTARLAPRLAAQVFDADAAARDLLKNDPEARQAVGQRFGSRILGAQGQVDRARLREIVFEDAQERTALEAILHPLIRERWIQAAQVARRDQTWLLVDIPLLFETGAERECDAVVVVACSPETQRERIISRRGLSPEMAEKMIASQTSLASKAVRADYVIWNDAPLARLDEQAELFAGYLLSYG
ncbi:MAG: dephospho-CoA kinase [Verrucomicrobia bacterium]|nr:dephospho-CoA kinase [Verrucomicrobiota bacterium]